jgi:hypothetical protein
VAHTGLELRSFCLSLLSALDCRRVLPCPAKQFVSFIYLLIFYGAEDQTLGLVHTIQALLY